jgi:putative salt-induced outer membrane protein YdiY
VATTCRAVLLGLVFIAAAASRAGAQQAEPIDRDLYLQLERTILLASARQDPMMLETMVAQDFVLRANPDVDRPMWLKSLMSGCWTERFDIERFEARQLGDTVATSFLLTLYRDPDTCRVAVMKSLVTSVWVFAEGHWQIALRQAVPPGTVAAVWTRQQFSKESERPIRFDVKGQLSFVATAGNVSTQTIGTGGEINYRKDAWATAVRSSYVSTMTEKGDTQAFGVDVREAHSRGPGRIETYGHAAFLRDEFAGINQRYAVDAGVGYPLIRTKRQAFKFDFGLGYTRELRFTGSQPAFPTAVASSVYTWSISPMSSLSNEIRVTSNLRHGSDWRLANSLSVTVALTRMLALKLADKLSYLNRPVAGFGSTDTVLSAALVVQFAR